MQIRAPRRCGAASRAGPVRRPPSPRRPAPRARTGPGWRRRRSGARADRSRRAAAAPAHRRWRPCSAASRPAPTARRPDPAVAAGRSPHWAAGIHASGARSSTTATDPHLLLTRSPNIHSIADYPERKPGHRHPAPGACIVSRLDEGKRCWRVLQGAPVHEAVHRVCISFDTCVEWGVENLWIQFAALRHQPLLSVIHTCAFCVDKNLFGVSGQVTVSGVLAFGQILAALRPVNEVRTGDDVGNSSPARRPGSLAEPAQGASHAADPAALSGPPPGPANVGV